MKARGGGGGFKAFRTAISFCFTGGKGGKNGSGLPSLNLGET